MATDRLAAAFGTRTGTVTVAGTAAKLAAPVGGLFASEAFSGAGLGLGMCRRLLGDLGGALKIKTVQPLGTRVQFTLDLPAP